MHNTKQVRSTLLSMIMAGALGVGFTTGASAQVGAGAAVGAGAEVAPSGGQAGGSADTHMSPSGSDNSNAQWKTDSTRGAVRAEERSSTGGMESGTEAEAAGGTTTTTP